MRSIDHDNCPMKRLYDVLLDNESPVPFEGKTLLALSHQILCMAAKDRRFLMSIIRALRTTNLDDEDLQVCVTTLLTCLHRMTCLDKNKIQAWIEEKDNEKAL